MKPPAYKLPHLLSLLPREGRSALVRQVDWPSNTFVKVTRTSLRYRPREGQEELRPHGKAWGLFFGQISNKPRSASPAPRIRGGLKHLWVTVDKDKLPQHVKDQIAESDKILAETTKAREEELAQRRIAKRERIAAARAQAKAEKAARAANAARVAKEIEAAKAGARA